MKLQSFLSDNHSEVLETQSTNTLLTGNVQEFNKLPIVC